MSKLGYAIPLLALFIAAPLAAKDVATEQYNVSAARKQYDTAHSEYDEVTHLIEVQKQRLAQEQSRLEDLQQRQQAAKAEMDKAQGRLKQQEKTLDKAWNTTH